MMGTDRAKSNPYESANDLKGVLSVSVILMIGRMGGVAANFALNILLARLMSPEDVGIVMLVISTSMLASILTTFNIEAGSIRHLLHAREQGDHKGSVGFVVFSRKVWTYASPVVMAGYLGAAYLLNPERVDSLSWIFLLGAVSIPVMGWLRMNTRQATVLSRQLAGSLPNVLLRPVLLVACLGLGVLAGLVLTPTVVLVVYAITAAVAAGTQLAVLRKTFGFVKSEPYSLDDSGRWAKTGMLLTASLVINEYFQDITLSTSALALPPEDIAKLAIALRLVGFLNFGLAAVNMAIGPKVGAAMARGDVMWRDRVLALASHVKIWPGILVGSLLVVFAEYILAIFGPEYVSAKGAFTWLLLMPAVMAVLGPNEMLLNTSGLQRYIFRSAAIAVGVALVSIPLGATWYGLEGAAAAAVGSFASWELLVYIAVRRKLGIDASVVGSVRTWFRGRD